MRVLLVDDEPLALERLKVFFRDIPEVEVVGTASDGPSAGQAISELKPDLVILDIQMPAKSGLAVAAELGEQDRPEIVFVTAFEQYAPDAFDVEATDYLLKPVRLDRLRQAVERARRRRRARVALSRVDHLEQALASSEVPGPSSEPAFADALWAPSRNGMVRVAMSSVDWIEAAKDYVLLHTPARSFILRATMGALEKKLDPERMMRVHRSAFVRPAAVQAVERLGKGAIALKLADGSAVQVGPNYARHVLERLRGCEAGEPAA
jgi:DNA-binding LytR/AlgR family response regulator